MTLSTPSVDSASSTARCFWACSRTVPFSSRAAPVARTTPLTRQRKTLPSFDQTFKKLVDNIESFDVSKVRYEEIQRSAIMAPPAAG